MKRAPTETVINLESGAPKRRRTTLTVTPGMQQITSRHQLLGALLPSFSESSQIAANILRRDPGFAKEAPAHESSVVKLLRTTGEERNATMCMLAGEQHAKIRCNMRDTAAYYKNMSTLLDELVNEWDSTSPGKRRRVMLLIKITHMVAQKNVTRGMAVALRDIRDMVDLQNECK